MAIVLAVEDDRLSQRLIEKVFRNAGHEVISADRIKSGLETLRRIVLVDLVVLDSHLGGEVGWDFVSEVRRRPLFRPLPIIVYTGYTERQEVLRYAALKVQAVHVKPIKAGVLLGELEKAMGSGGARSDVLEDPEFVCERLKLNHSEYAMLLLDAVPHLEEDRAVVARQLRSTDDNPSLAALERLGQRGRELGIRRMGEYVELTQEQFRRADIAAASDALLGIGAVIRQVRQRALGLLGANASADPQALERTMSAPREAMESPPANPWSAMTRQILHRPFWTFSSSLARVPGAGLTATALHDVVFPLLQGDEAVRVWLEGIELIESIPRLDLPDAAKILGEVPDFAPSCERIVQRTTLSEQEREEEAGLLDLARRLGVVPAVILAALARIVRAPVASPLELQPLRQHAAGVALLAFELARLFKVSDPEAVAAAALGCHLGLWGLAVAEPGLMALALAAVERGVPLTAAVEGAFGAPFQEVSARLLATKGKAQWIQDAARAGAPAATPAEPTVVDAIIALADHLVRTAEADSPPEMDRARSELRRSEHATWVALRARGVQLPRDMKEFADVVMTLAATTAWTVHEAAA